jgi:hypothetical protein
MRYLNRKRGPLILVVLFMAVLHTASSWAAFERWGMGADVCAMSITGVSREDPLFVPFINPAANCVVHGWRLSTHYSRRFNMRELTQVGFSLSGDTGGILLSIGGEKFGNRLYSEELAIIGFGYPVTAGTRIGMAARLHRLRIDGYGEAISPGFDLAWSSSPNEHLNVGAVWRNINRPDLGSSGTKVPSCLIVGIEGSISERMVCMVEGVKAAGEGGRIGLGFAFAMSRELTMRMGYRRDTGEYSLGTTLHLPLVRWDYAISVHSVLGFTHYFSLSVGGRPAPTATP